MGTGRHVQVVSLHKAYSLLHALLCQSQPLPNPQPVLLRKIKRMHPPAFPTEHHTQHLAWRLLVPQGRLPLSSLVPPLPLPALFLHGLPQLGSLHMSSVIMQ